CCIDSCSCSGLAGHPVTGWLVLRVAAATESKRWKTGRDFDRRSEFGRRTSDLRLQASRPQTSDVGPLSRLEKLSKARSSRCEIQLGSPNYDDRGLKSDVRFYCVKYWRSSQSWSS